jgi:hypothetical protein
MSIKITAAEDLARNDRVVRYTDEMPELVESVREQEDGRILIRFASGDELTCDALAAMIVRD